MTSWEIFSVLSKKKKGKQCKRNILRSSCGYLDLSCDKCVLYHDDQISGVPKIARDALVRVTTRLRASVFDRDGAFAAALL